MQSTVNHNKSGHQWLGEEQCFPDETTSQSRIKLKQNKRSTNSIKHTHTHTVK